MDLRRVPQNVRDQEGQQLAKKLVEILNSDSRFSVLALSRNPQGDQTSGAAQNRQDVATISQNGRNLTLDVEQVTLQNGGPAVWLFSQETVRAIPNIQVSSAAPAIERYIPAVLVHSEFLDTALWKWLALMVIAIAMISLSRMIDRVLLAVAGLIKDRFHIQWQVPWIEVLSRPIRVMLWLAVLRIGIGVVNPSAVARLYIGRGLQIVFVWMVAWCVVRVVDLLLMRLEARLETPQQLASRTILRLGRRTANVTIAVFAILVILQSWGYNTATLLAGLGVGGIAIALAAQQTLANVFGGVSLIGDNPIAIGELGKFGDMVGVVEDIGMRSTRVRTLNRTVISVPNSNFAGLNLENYSSRDKLLFNPTFQIKRTTSDDQIRDLLARLTQLISGRNDLERLAVPARMIGLASGSFAIELFCYVLTTDMNVFYKVQGEMLLAINHIFQELNIELA